MRLSRLSKDLNDLSEKYPNAEIIIGSDEELNNLLEVIEIGNIKDTHDPQRKVFVMWGDSSSRTEEF